MSIYHRIDVDGVTFRCIRLPLCTTWHAWSRRLTYDEADHGIGSRAAISLETRCPWASRAGTRVMVRLTREGMAECKRRAALTVASQR